MEYLFKSNKSYFRIYMYNFDGLSIVENNEPFKNFKF